MYSPLQGNVAIGDGDHGQLELLGRGRQGQEHGKDIVNACIKSVPVFGGL